MNSTATPSTSDRFSLILDGLLRKVAARIAGGALQATMILMIWRKIRRIENQVQGLLKRFLAGRLVVRAGVAGGTGGGRTGPRPDGLPRHFAWLLVLVPFEAANFASQLRVVLAEPDMVALLEASPQAGRVLRPLCRMLGLEASVLAPCLVERAEVGPVPTEMRPVMDRSAMEDSGGLGEGAAPERPAGLDLDSG